MCFCGVLIASRTKHVHLEYRVIAKRSGTHRESTTSTQHVHYGATHGHEGSPLPFSSAFAESHPDSAAANSQAEIESEQEESFSKPELPSDGNTSLSTPNRPTICITESPVSARAKQAIEDDTAAFCDGIVPFSDYAAAQMLGIGEVTKVRQR